MCGRGLGRLAPARALTRRGLHVLPPGDVVVAVGVQRPGVRIAVFAAIRERDDVIDVERTLDGFAADVAESAGPLENQLAFDPLDGGSFEASLSALGGTPLA